MKLVIKCRVCRHPLSCVVVEGIDAWGRSTQEASVEPCVACMEAAVERERARVQERYEMRDRPWD